VIGAWAKASGKQVEVHNAGVGSRSGELVLHVPLHRGRQVGTRASFTAIDDPHVDVRVPVVTIDSLQLDPVGFAKIDVEGFEYDVLLGAQRTLERDRPTLLVELDRNRHERATFDRIMVMLAGMGYVPHVLHDGHLEACAEAPWDMAARYYNFVFLQDGRAD
jgi:FkbM family methyltransferase